jgi:hypothetical protein
LENRKRITEEDLLVTEALIAESYGQLKQSVVQAPSRALSSAGNTVRGHPYAAAVTAIVAGVAVYGIYKMMKSRPAGQNAGSTPRQKERGGTDLLQGLLPALIPVITPYLAGYIQKYLGTIQAGKRG